MLHNKIIKDKRGTVRIQVSLWTDPHGFTDNTGKAFRYDVRVWHTPPKKRTETISHSIATPSEIFEAKTECWNLIIPSL